MLVSLLRIKKGNHAPPPFPEIKLNKMKKIAQPMEFRLKYAKKHQNTLVHVHKNVCLNGFYFFLFYFKAMHAFFVVLLFVLFLLVYNCDLSMYSLARLEQRFFHLYCM